MGSKGRNNKKAIDGFWVIEAENPEFEGLKVELKITCNLLDGVVLFLL